MYTIKYGADYLFYPGSDTALAHDAKLSQHAGAAYSTFTITIPTDNPLYDDIELHDVDNLVVLAYDETVLFRGVVVSAKIGMWLEKTLTCADELVFLDWVQTRYKPYGLTARTCLEELVAIYNSYARLKDSSGVDRFLFAVDPACISDENGVDSVGYVNPSNPNQRLVDCETSTPTSILQTIRRGMVDDYGAFLRVRYLEPLGSGSTPYRLIGLFSYPPDDNTQVIRLGENLVDYDYSVSDDGMYNACLPIGGTLDDELPYTEPSRLSTYRLETYDSTTLRLTADSGTVTLEDNGILLLDSGISYVVSGNYTVGQSPVDVTIHPRTVYVVPADMGVTYVGKNPYYRDKACTLGRLNAQTVGAYYCDTEIVYHVADAKRYGIKCMTYRDSTIQDANVLLNKAIAMIEPCRAPKTSLTVTAVDAAYYGDYVHLQAGERVRVVSEPHGLDEWMYVVSADIDLQNPENTRYQLGTVETTLSRKVRENGAAIDNETSNTMIELNNTITDTTIGALS